MSLALRQRAAAVPLLILFAITARAADVQPPTALRTVSYHWSVTPDYGDERLTATARMTLTNPADSAVTEIPLTLYRLLRVTSVEDDLGAPVPFTQQVRTFTDWERMQVNTVTVTPPAPLGPGDSLSFAVAYEGPLLGYEETGMRYVRDHIDEAFTILRPDCGAYPEPGTNSWRANRAMGLQEFSYTLEATVPDTLIPANGGRLLERIEHGDGTVTWRYENILPAWRMDIAIAPYELRRFGPNRVYHFPDHAEGIDRLAAGMEACMALFEDKLGPRPTEHGIAVIEIPEGYGSQTDVTAILQTADAFSPDARLYPFYHELSHLWNVEMLDPLPSRMESEGLAMFLQYWTEERLGDRRHALDKGMARLRESLAKSLRQRPEHAETAMADYGENGLTGLSYTKGALFFGLLYDVLGEDAFFAAIRSFYEQHPGGATLRQFTDHLQQVTEVDLAPLLRDWVYEGRPSSELVLSDEPLKQWAGRYR